MKLRILPAVLGVAMLAACAGGSADELNQATPSFDAMTMDISDLDAEPPGASTALTVDPGNAELAGADACHPHLFLRDRKSVV